jgi:hypothetical protein
MQIFVINLGTNLAHTIVQLWLVTSVYFITRTDALQYILELIYLPTYYKRIMGDLFHERMNN